LSSRCLGEKEELSGRANVIEAIQVWRWAGKLWGKEQTPTPKKHKKTNGDSLNSHRFGSLNSKTRYVGFLVRSWGKREK